jgi:FkbM family methyltransferase
VSPVPSAASQLRSTLKRGAWRLRASRPGVRSFGWLAIHGYPGRAPAGRRARAAAAALTYCPASPELRTATVPLLTELFFDLVALTDSERFVEAGAKEASASVHALDIDGVESVTAFEANPYTYERFAPRLDDLPLRYEHVALGDAVGEASFRVLRNSDGDPSPDGRGSLLERIDYAPGFETLSVPSVTLDGYFDGDRRARTALWIDVEGATGAVLRGARRLLRDATVVIVEVEERPTWQGDHWLRQAVVEYLHEHGLAPVARDLQSRFQHNIVFVRRDLSADTKVTDRIDRWAGDVGRLVRTAPLARA